MDKIRALRYFKRVVEVNSFSLAAREFDVPASSISRRIRDLEQELGVALIKRTTRNVSTTELGELYYAQISDVLCKLDEADALISQRHEALEGKLRISAMPIYGERVLLPVLNQFRKAYPKIHIELDLSDKSVVFSQEAVDIAVRAGGIGEEDRLIAKTLASGGFALVATPELLERLQQQLGRAQLSAEDLSLCPCLMYMGRHGRVPWWRLDEENWQELDIKPVLSSNNGSALLNATVAGEGIALFPHWWVSPELECGELVEVPIDSQIAPWRDTNLDIFLLYQSAKYQIPKIKHCVDFILEQLGPGACRE